MPAHFFIVILWLFFFKQHTNVKTIYMMESNQALIERMTERLESYASQVSALQTRMEMQAKENELQAEIKDLRKENAALRSELEATRADLAAVREQLRVACEERDGFKLISEQVQKRMDTVMVDNAFLKNCIMLSLGSIKDFVRMVRRIDLKALLYTMLTKTLSPEMGVRGLEAINEAVDLTDVPELEKIADTLLMDNHGTVNTKD